MDYKLKRPCDDCPFLREGGIRLAGPERIREILDDRVTFPCHKTVDYDDDAEDGQTMRSTGREQACVGRTIFQLKAPGQHLDQMARISMRLKAISEKEKPTGLDPDALEGHDLVFDSLEEMKAAQGWPEFKPTGTGEPCSIVDRNCTAPAGWAIGGGVEDNDEADAEHWCTECGEAVCTACSTSDGSGGRICNNCNDEEW